MNIREASIDEIVAVNLRIKEFEELVEYDYQVVGVETVDDPRPNRILFSKLL